MRYTAALAGLLHDIGKFWQRAEASATQVTAPGYEKFNKEDFGPHGTHATWSALFVERVVPEAFRHTFGYAALYHHRPQDALSRLVALADRLASGERLPSNEEWPPAQVTVFSQLAGYQHTAYWPLRPLALDEESLFPSDSAPDSRTSRAAYRALWAEFVREAGTLQGETDLPAYIESMQNLLRRYTWSVPSAYYNSLPDISLYDHSRVTAALAACLAGQEEVVIERLLHRRDDTVVARLVEGDISGVQRFIYTVTAKGAAKTLRGRSLYLQLLTEAAARLLLRRLELPVTNLIYAGGGHFYLLIPPDSDEVLAATRRELDTLLLAHHDGDLYLALGVADLAASDFAPGEFSKKWRETGQAIGRDKRRRFAHFAPSELAEQVFAARGAGDSEEYRRRYVEREEIEGVDDPDRSKLSASLQELGQRLTGAAYLVLGEIAPQPQPPGAWQNILAQLGMSVGLLDEHGQWVLRPEQVGFERTTVLGLRDFLPQNLTASMQRALNCPVASGIRFTVNVAPRKNRYEVATFEDLQEASTGLKRLGVLRMDVDDLGRLFAAGFERQSEKKQVEKHATLARVAGLSSALSLFFEGWVGTLCRDLNGTERRKIKSERAEGRLEDAVVEVVHAIYSGGDDLFLVGAWDVLPELARTISADLRRFAAGNPAVHVSAGITLHGGKYPLYQAAQDAHRALDAAKDRDGKNAIAFLGQSVGWEGAPVGWEDVVAWQRELVDLTDTIKVRGLLSVLIQLHADYADAQKHVPRGKNGQAQVLWGPWMWRGAYLLTRLAERVPGDARQRVLNIRDRLGGDGFRSIEIMGLAARWAEALTRKEKAVEEA